MADQHHCPTCGSTKIVKARTDELDVEQPPDAHRRSYEFSICHGCGWNDLPKILKGI